MSRLFLVFFITIFILFFSSALNSQQISTQIYEKEEDLLEGLENGEIDYDQFLELLDLLQNPVDTISGEAEKLLNIPDVSSLEILELKQAGFLEMEKTLAFIKSEKPTMNWWGKFWSQVKQNLKEDEDERKLFNLQSGLERKAIFNVQIEQERKGLVKTKRRSMKFSLPFHFTQITLGNYEFRSFLGIGLGFYPYSNLGSIDPEFTSMDFFLYPSLSRYNGVLLQSQGRAFSPKIFFSKNKRDPIETSLIGGEASYFWKNLKTSLQFSQTQIQNRLNSKKFSDQCLSLGSFWQNEWLKLSFEFAQLKNKENGWGSNLVYLKKRVRVDFSFWNYSENFFYFYSGGIANPDYQKIYLPELDYSFNSRQAGEKGILFKSKYQLNKKLNFNFALNQWKAKNLFLEKLKTKTGIDYVFSPVFSVSLDELYSDENLEEKGEDFLSHGLILRYFPSKKLCFRFKTELKSRRNELEKINSKNFQFRSDFKTFTPFDLSLWLKFYDSPQIGSDYFSWQIEERVHFFTNYSFNLHFYHKIYQDKVKNYASVWLSLEGRW
jgi:hypothetical protein